MNAITRHVVVLSIASTAILARVLPAFADVAVEPTLPEKATEVIRNAGDTPAAAVAWRIGILGGVGIVVLVVAGGLVLWGVMRLRRTQAPGGSPNEGSES